MATLKSVIGTKKTAVDRSNPLPDEKLTADEVNIIVDKVDTKFDAESYSTNPADALQDAKPLSQGQIKTLAGSATQDYAAYTAYTVVPADTDISPWQAGTTKLKATWLQLKTWLTGVFDLRYVQQIAGKGLSTEDYTTAEKQKLAGLDGPHWKGSYTTYEALVAAHPTAVAGDEAEVDNPGADVQRYVWDATDTKWVVQQGASTAETAASIKTKYESNPDTNAFTDAEKTKLGGLSNYTDEQAQDAAAAAILLGTTGATYDDVTGAITIPIPGNATPQTLTDGASVPMDVTAGYNGVLTFGALAAREIVISNLADGENGAIHIPNADGQTVNFQTGFSHYIAGAGAASSYTFPDEASAYRAVLYFSRIGNNIFWSPSLFLVEADAGADLSVYQKKAVPAQLPTTGTWAVTLDQDKESYAGTLTGNVTLTVSGMVLGAVAVIIFQANGTATVTLPAGAVSEGGAYVSTNGTVNKLWMRAGLSASGGETLYYQWA